uniref:Myosin binding protein C2 n=1 Tax=Nomascus leucogenys TaxID=61853 RepID=M3Z903_NOMLE
KGKDAPKGAPKEAPPKEAPAEAPKEASPEDQSPTAEEPTGIFLKKPDSVSVETGKDVVVVAKVNGKELPDKPTIKWFKGKWLELGSKSGARFSFKESHDSASNVRTPWARGPAEGSGACAGLALCREALLPEASMWAWSRDGEWASEDGGCAGLLGRGCVKQREDAWRWVGVHWGFVMYVPGYVFENVGKKRILTINKCTLADDAAYEVAVKDEKCFTELFVKEPAVLIVTPLEDQQVFVGDRVEMAVEVSEEGAQVMWMKDGVELTREDSFKARYRFKKDGKRHILIFSDVVQEDRGRYQVITNGGQCEAELIVEEKQLEVLQDIADLTVKASEQAVFKCEVSDEKVTGKWYKNGIEVRPSKRITISHVGRFSCGDWEGPASHSQGPCISSVPPEPPKIHLDCSGKTSENTIVVVAGTREPPPVATWLKGDEVFTTTEGRTRIEKRVDCSSFVIESAEREDEGRYTIKVTNPAGEDVASIFLQVVGEQRKPCASPRLERIGAILVWEPPTYDGGKPVTGYLVERKKKGSQRWMKLNFEVFTETTYESTKMIEGILYEMRVFAVNAIGVSQPSMNTKPFMPIAPTSEPLHLIVEDVTDTTTTLKWRPPSRIGAGGIDGYLVEYCLEGSEEWVPANTEPVERCGFTVKNLPTGARILFRVVGVNIAGRSEPATLAQPVTIREIAEPPKIRLPRHLRQTYIRKVGEQLNLVVPFQGRPRPQVVWTKGGAPLDTSRVHVRTSDFDTVFFVRQAARSDSGEYELSVQIENMKDTATIRIRVVEKAGPPINVMVKEVWGTNALVEWQAPKDDGNSEITGYFVQKADKKTMEWFNVYERNRHTSCTVSDLIVGNEYYFRVYTENICGLSDSPGVSKNTARILKTGITFKPFEYKEHDFRMAPKFLTPLIDRVVVAGYSAALNCAVRGHPKPKVVWMKNKMEIREDPKFLITNYQGVLTLNIRRPSPFDAGTYTCRAVNELGEALAECKLEVRGEGVAVPNTG